MAGVSLIEGSSSLASCRRKISSLQLSRVALSFTSSHQLCLSLMRLESAHIRSSTTWGATSKSRNSPRGTHTYRPWVFLSLISFTAVRRILEGVFESTLWKLERPSPLGFLASRKQFLHGGWGFGYQPKFRFGGRVFSTSGVA